MAAQPSDSSLQCRGHRAKVETELGGARFEAGIEVHGIESPQGAPVRLGGPLEDGNSQTGDEQRRREGQVEPGLEQPRRSGSKERQRGETDGVQGGLLAVEKASQQIGANHERGPQRRRALLDQRREAEQEQQDQAGPPTLTQAQQPEQRFRQHGEQSNVKAGNHQKMIEAHFAESFDGIGIERRAVPEQHGFEDSSVAAFGQPGWVEAVDALKQAPPRAFSQARHSSRRRAGTAVARARTCPVGRGPPASFDRRRTPDVSNPIDIFDRFHPTPEVKAAGVAVDLRPAQADLGVDEVAVLGLERLRRSPGLGVLHGFEAQANLARDQEGWQAVPRALGLEARRLNVELRAIGRALRV